MRLRAPCTDEIAAHVCGDFFKLGPRCYLEFHFRYLIFLKLLCDVMAEVQHGTKHLGI